MKLVPLMLLCSLVRFPAHSTVLGDLVKTMSPGDWKELSTTGFTVSLLSSGESYHYITQYSDDATWNPGTEEVHYIGGGHLGVGKHIVYSAATNAWREETRQAWMEPLGHGYDHNALDQAKQVLYHHSMNGRLIIYRYDIPTKSWRSGFPIPPTTCAWSEMTCCRGDEFFPDYNKGGIVICDGAIGAVFFFGTTTGKWETLGKNLAMYSYHNIAKYNPVHKVVLLGGGNGSHDFYRLDSLGVITKLKPSPVALGIAQAVVTVDPASGDYLSFDQDRNFYSFNIKTDTWTRRSGSVPFFDIGSDGAAFGAVATPVSTYGVVLVMKYSAGGPKVYIYKHAEGQIGAEKAVTPGVGPLEISVRPNPVRGTALIGTARGAFVRVVDSRGRPVARLRAGAAGTVVWDASSAPAGVYLAKSSVGTRSVTRRMLKQ